VNQSDLRIPDRGRVGWWIITLLLVSVLAGILYAFLGTFVLGLFIYYATRPVFDRLDQIGQRSLRAMVALLVVALPVLVLVAYTVTIGVRELSALAGTDLTAYQQFLQPYVDLSGARSPTELFGRILEDPGQLASLGDTDSLRGAAESLGAYLGGIASGLLQVGIAFAVAFYLLRDDHRIAGWARTQIGHDDDVLITYGRAVDTDLKTIYFGNILNAFVVAVLSAVTYNALNLVAPAGLAVPAPTLLGLLTGAASLIPVVGMKVIYVPIALYLGAIAALSDPALLWFPIVFLLITVALIDGLTEILLRPYISGRNLHVGLVLFAYILGPLLFGWYGLFLGPLLLVLIVHLFRIVVPELVHGEPLTPTATATDPLPNPRKEEQPEPEVDPEYADGPLSAGPTAEPDDGSPTGAQDGNDDADGPP
jgi:predicted PurR-regulated permease PerM